MKILLLSYGIIDYDGRLIELYDVANKLGDVTLFCCGNSKQSTKKEKIFEIGKRKYLSKYTYISFILKALFYTFRMKKIDILIIDNYFATIVALIIKQLCDVRFIVQDVRELYFIEDMKSWTGRLFIQSEVKLMGIADVVLAANSYRADIMQRYYKLNRRPMVFENVRFLTGNYDKSYMDIKYNSTFKYKINVVSTGGLSVLRGSDRLVEAMKKLPLDYGLFLVGSGSEDDIKVIDEIINQTGLKNVHLINIVPLSELRYIIQQCDIGIVNYHKNDLNNKYCASGKVYEYLAEGLPIVTTENIPLKDFCNKYQIGEADDTFYRGILKVSDNIDEYKKNVKSFITEVSVEKYNTKIADEILSILNGKDN